MKSRLVLSVLALAGLIGCKEKGPAIDFSDVLASDTVYMAAVETPQTRAVLLEEFTGVTCPNCPRAHAAIKNFQRQYPGRIIAISYYANGMTQTQPVHGLSIQDFRTDDATELGLNYFGGIPFLPCGSVDRTPDNGALLYQMNKWGALLESRLPESTPANLHITSRYNPDTREITATVKTAFTGNLENRISLTLALVENGIIDAQEDGLIIDTFYTHSHVLRDIITPPAGISILDTMTVKQAGLVYERHFTFSAMEHWKPENCNIIAFLTSNDGTGKQVIQAAEIPVQSGGR